MRRRRRIGQQVVEPAKHDLRHVHPRHQVLRIELAAFDAASAEKIDYEWMLTQKILRQTILFPEKRNLAVSEYKRLKTTIAKKWLQSDLGVVELIPNNKQEQEIAAGYIDLKVTLAYGEWGFDDIITFRLPATIQRQLEGSKVELLDWVNENLMDTYVGE